MKKKTLRDEFAMAALQGFLAGADPESLERYSGSEIAAMMAQASYKAADAMMLARKR